MFNPFLFRDFEPSPEFHAASNLVLSAALELAPEDSIAFGSIRKDKDVFRGHLEICSSCGVFSAYANSKNAEEVLNKLRKRIFRSLKSWRRTYFPPPPTSMIAKSMAAA